MWNVVLSHWRKLAFELKGQSKVTVQIRTDDFYRAFPDAAVEADVHGIRMRVASLADTLAGKLAALADPQHRGSKRQKDLLDIVRLIEAHPELLETIPLTLRKTIDSAMQ